MKNYFDPIAKTLSELEQLIARVNSFGRGLQDTVTIKTDIADICNYSKILLAAAQSDVRGPHMTTELMGSAARALTTARMLADKNGLEMSGLGCLELWRDELQHKHHNHLARDLAA